MASEDFGGLESLQVLLQQNPNSLTFGRVADALLKLGRVDEAIQLCEDGLRRHPSYVTGHMVLGKCYLKKKLFDQAEKEFKRVLLFDPKYLAAHKYYGDLMREIGWDNTCEMSYRKILQIDPLDKSVRAVIEELAQKTKTEKPEPMPKRREVKPAAESFAPSKPNVPPPRQEDKFFSSINAEESDDFRFQAAAENDDVMPPTFETESEPEIAPTIPARATPDADDERFSYILDDIFQDEVSDEKPVPAPPANKNSLPPENRRATFATESQDDEGFDDDETKGFSEPLPPRHETNRRFGANSDGMEQTARPPAKIQTRPVDFDLDFDEVPPASPPDAEKNLPIKASGFDLEGLEADENKILARPNSRSAGASKLPARRPRTLDEPRGNDEPALLSPTGEREKIVTPTLGEIYAAQGQYTKAIGVFELLSKKEPNNRHYREKIDYLKKRLQETQNAG